MSRRIRPHAVQGRLDRRRGPRPRPRRAGWSTTIAREIAALAPRFPHDADYLEAVQVDFRRWADEGFGTPDFLDSLVLFRPDQHRVDGLQHLVVFPMYTQNGNLDRNVEALLISVVWPRVAGRARADLRQPDVPADQLRRLHRRLRHQLGRALPRDGRGARGADSSTGARIFCDREAARFRRVSTAAAQTLKLQLPPDAERLVDHQGWRRAPSCCGT